MKIKKLGTLVELDPKKKYIMLIDADCLTEEQASQIASSGIKDGTIIYAHKIGEGITFVKDSDKIIGIKYLKKDD